MPWYTFGVRWAEFVARQRAAHGSDPLSTDARAGMWRPLLVLVAMAVPILLWATPDLARAVILILVALAIGFVLRQTSRR